MNCRIEYFASRKGRDRIPDYRKSLRNTKRPFTFYSRTFNLYEMSSLYLTGYEKETVEEFTSKLKENKITMVIDVREIPLSHKNGFSKNNLERELLSCGIQYFHFPQLGSPTSIRQELRSNTGDYLKFFKSYRMYLKKKRRILHELNSIITGATRPSLLCFERYSELCHRSIIASELLKMNSNLRVIPI